jgi:hypothetical protein
MEGERWIVRFTVGGREREMDSEVHSGKEGEREREREMDSDVHSGRDVVGNIEERRKRVEVERQQVKLENKGKEEGISSPSACSRLSYPILSNPILSYSLLSYPLLSSPILS